MFVGGSTPRKYSLMGDHPPTRKLADEAIFGTSLIAEMDRNYSTWFTALIEWILDR